MPRDGVMSAGGTVLRTATDADLPALHALVERAYRGDAARGGWTHEADLLGGQRTDLDALAATLADPDQRILPAVYGDTLVGCVHIRKAAHGAYLGLLTVDPERQARGLGAVLIAAAEEQAAELFGTRAMEITVIPNAAN